MSDRVEKVSVADRQPGEKRPYSAPRLLILAGASATNSGTLGSQNDGTNAVTASVAGS